MGEPITVFVGCDIGDKFTDVCVLDQDGAVVEQARVRAARRSLERHLEGFGRARVVLEVGMHSRWVAAALGEAGHEVIVANPRQVRLIWNRPRKTDQSDALLLARLGRVDVALLAPVRHRSREAHSDLAGLRARDQLFLSTVAEDGSCRMGRGSLGEVLPASIRVVLGGARSGAGDRVIGWAGPRREHRLLIPGRCVAPRTLAQEPRSAIPEDDFDRLDV